MPFNNAQVQSGLLKKLNMYANEFKQIMMATIDEVNAPKEIKKHISIGKAEKSGENLSIEITIDTSKDAAPMAPAYEWGSGEHATRGGKGKYVIEPDKANLLAFDWEPQTVPWGSPKFFGAILEGKESTKGRYFFHFVEHPGVAPRPFIAPSIRKLLPKMKQELGGVIKAEILAGTERVTVISA